MKNKQILLYISFIVTNTILFGSEPSNITYRQALPKDVVGIVELIKTHTPLDKKKYIVFPDKFMPEIIQKAVDKKHIFIAEDEQTKQIIAYKEIFLIDNMEKFNETLEELGYVKNAQLIDSTHITSENNYQKRNSSSYNYIPNITNANICLNFDFTNPKHRNQRINKTLTTFAFNHIQPEITAHINNNASDEIILLYGLSCLNDYPIDSINNYDEHNKENHKPGIASRTPGIACSYAEFIKNIIGSSTLPDINHQRVVTYMPVYNKKATVNEPLPTNEWIPSSGNVLSYVINNTLK